MSLTPCFQTGLVSKDTSNNSNTSNHSVFCTLQAGIARVNTAQVRNAAINELRILGAIYIDNRGRDYAVYQFGDWGNYATGVTVASIADDQDEVILGSAVSPLFQPSDTFPSEDFSVVSVGGGSKIGNGIRVSREGYYEVTVNISLDADANETLQLRFVDENENPHTGSSLLTVVVNSVTQTQGTLMGIMELDLGPTSVVAIQARASGPLTLATGQIQTVIRKLLG